MAWLAILGAGTAHRHVARGERAVFLLDEQFDIERDIAVLLGNLHQDRYRDLPAVVDRKPPRSSIRPRDRKSVGGLVLHESAQLLAYRGLDDRVEIENKKLTVFRDREETKFVRGPLGIRDLDGESGCWATRPRPRRCGWIANRPSANIGRARSREQHRRRSGSGGSRPYPGQDRPPKSCPERARRMRSAWTATSFLRRRGPRSGHYRRSGSRPCKAGTDRSVLPGAKPTQPRAKRVSIEQSQPSAWRLTRRSRRRRCHSAWKFMATPLMQ